ncbi:MAG: glycine--tRNA ligase subunit beta [Buchnera aphidicola (Eriosoma harunire)]
MNQHTFLIELGVEELPAKKLYSLALLFHKKIQYEFKKKYICYDNSKWFASPNRIAVQINHVYIDKKNQETIIKGPSLKNAFNQQNELTNHAIFWMKKLNITLQETCRIKKQKNEYLAYKKNSQRKIQTNIFPEIIMNAIDNISIGKLMKWNQSEKKFFRPIRTITTMYNNTIIPLKIFNISSDQKIRGHQILNTKTITLKHAKDYEITLQKEGHVIACFHTRQNIIKEKSIAIAHKINGTIKIHDNLLNEITSLVEWPTVYMAEFKKKFLKLPDIAILHIIQNNQKCIPIYQNNKLSSYFIFISNINTKNPQNIIIGNQRVVNARLSDAEFFFTEDRKKSLKEHLILLKNVLFYKKLGTLYDKTIRLQNISQYIANIINENQNDIQIAAQLSKCDLISNMVIAFPETQGIMGMHYALLDNINIKIAHALRDQYKPEYSEDTLPTNIIGDILSISDKIDLITGMFTIGKVPSSIQDPFALRRSAIGILKIIIQKKIPINLTSLIQKSILLHKRTIDITTMIKKIESFFNKRLYDIYHKQGHNYNIIHYILLKHHNDLLEFDCCIQAVHTLKTNKQFKLIQLAYKRIKNITKKIKHIPTNNINIQLLKSTNEKILLNIIQRCKCDFNTKSIQKKYTSLLQHIIQLTPIIHCFFNSNIINHSNPNIALNRINLLKTIEELFLLIIDFTLIE